LNPIAQLAMISALPDAIMSRGSGM